jgi:hypothetical protein
MSGAGRSNHVPAPPIVVKLARNRTVVRQFLSAKPAHIHKPVLLTSPGNSASQICCTLLQGRFPHQGPRWYSVSTVAFEGIEVRPVDLQVQVAPGMPAFTIVG